MLWQGLSLQLSSNISSHDQTLQFMKIEFRHSYYVVITVQACISTIQSSLDSWYQMFSIQVKTARRTREVYPALIISFSEYHSIVARTGLWWLTNIYWVRIEIHVYLVIGGKNYCTGNPCYLYRILCGRECYFVLISSIVKIWRNDPAKRNQNLNNNLMSLYTFFHDIDHMYCSSCHFLVMKSQLITQCITRTSYC